MMMDMASSLPNQCEENENQARDVEIPEQDIKQASNLTEFIVGRLENANFSSMPKVPRYYPKKYLAGKIVGNLVYGIRIGLRWVRLQSMSNSESDPFQSLDEFLWNLHNSNSSPGLRGSCFKFCNIPEDEFTTVLSC